MTERRLLYLDSSALVKLVIEEEESGALAKHLEGWPQRITSAVAGVEVTRAARRAGGIAALERARELLTNLALIELDTALTAAAGIVDPPTLRSLDAIHLAMALSLGDDLGAFAAYDLALAGAAAAAGLVVVAPR